jgi:hypothetical protein
LESRDSWRVLCFFRIDRFFEDDDIVRKGSQSIGCQQNEGVQGLTYFLDSSIIMLSSTWPLLEFACISEKSDLSCFPGNRSRFAVCRAHCVIRITVQMEKSGRFAFQIPRELRKERDLDFWWASFVLCCDNGGSCIISFVLVSQPVTNQTRSLNEWIANSPSYSTRRSHNSINKDEDS